MKKMHTLKAVRYAARHHPIRRSTTKPEERESEEMKAAIYGMIQEVIGKTIEKVSLEPYYKEKENREFFPAEDMTKEIKNYKTPRKIVPIDDDPKKEKEFIESVAKTYINTERRAGQKWPQKVYAEAIIKNAINELILLHEGGWLERWKKKNTPILHPSLLVPVILAVTTIPLIIYYTVPVLRLILCILTLQWPKEPDASASIIGLTATAGGSLALWIHFLSRRRIWKESLQNLVRERVRIPKHPNAPFDERSLRGWWERELSYLLDYGHLMRALEDKKRDKIIEMDEIAAREDNLYRGAVVEEILPPTKKYPYTKRIVQPRMRERIMQVQDEQKAAGFLRQSYLKSKPETINRTTKRNALKAIRYGATQNSSSEKEQETENQKWERQLSGAKATIRKIAEKAKENHENNIHKALKAHKNISDTKPVYRDRKQEIWFVENLIRDIEKEEEALEEMKTMCEIARMAYEELLYTSEGIRSKIKQWTSKKSQQISRKARIWRYRVKQKLISR